MLCLLQLGWGVNGVSERELSSLDYCDRSDYQLRVQGSQSITLKYWMLEIHDSDIFSILSDSAIDIVCVNLCRCGISHVFVAVEVDGGFSVFTPVDLKFGMDRGFMTGLGRDFGGGWLHGNKLGTSSSPFFTPPSKCALHILVCLLTLSSKECLIFLNHCRSKFGFLSGKHKMIAYFYILEPQWCGTTGNLLKICFKNMGSLPRKLIFARFTGCMQILCWGQRMYIVSWALLKLVVIIQYPQVYSGEEWGVSVPHGHSRNLLIFACV